MNITSNIKGSQPQLIYNHLINYGSITSIEAFEKYGITRLAAVIFILRRRGFNIISITETGKNRFGNPVTYTRYVLEME